MCINKKYKQRKTDAVSFSTHVIGGNRTDENNFADHRLQQSFFKLWKIHAALSVGPNADGLTGIIGSNNSINYVINKGDFVYCTININNKK